MDLEELKRTHKDYTANVANWMLYKAAYEGTKSLLEWGALKKHDRESEENHNNRVEQAYGYNFTRRLITIINTLLSQKKPTNDYGDLGKDELFNLFLNNCDFEGTSLESWLLDRQLSSSILGHAGVLIDKPLLESDAERTDSQDIEDKNYPYLSAYSALNILDWDFERINGKPILTHVKVIDDCCNYRLWWRDKWETWEIDHDTGDPIKIEEGINPLEVIPFLWLVQGESGNRFIGVSAAEEVSRIDVSIIRNLSQGEEVIDYSAFQILQKPMLTPGDKEDDTVGPRGVIEFDPMNPQSKSEWLKSDAGQPIDAILSWIDSKVVEMARMFNASAFFSQSKSAVSGESRKREFQLMNSRLSGESKSLEVFEKNIIYFYLLWQGKTELLKNIIISRPRDFDVSDKVEEQDALVVAKSTVNSTKFQQEVDKKMVGLVMPDIPLNVVNEINTEIENQKEVPLVEADTG